jgi:hypothetical protein
MDRRSFLQRTAAGLAAGLTTAACGNNVDDDFAELARPALVEMLGPERTRQVGTQYRTTVPRESTIAALREAISSSRHHAFPWLWNQSIDDRVRDDFAAGRVVVVSGWVLSETEARQAALYSLST